MSYRRSYRIWGGKNVYRRVFQIVYWDRVVIRKPAHRPLNNLYVNPAYGRRDGSTGTDAAMLYSSARYSDVDPFYYRLPIPYNVDGSFVLTVKLSEHTLGPWTPLCTPLWT